MVAHPVDPDRERALGGDRRVQLAQRACGGVARVRRRALALGGLALSEFLEAGERHVDLAADFEHRRRRLALR